MPTSPSEQSHQARQIAESFGIDPERYDRARPRYPADLIDQIVAKSPGKSVLDVGIGTGIVARQLQAAGCTVLGVEPDARMAEFARKGAEPTVAQEGGVEPGSAATDFALRGGGAWTDGLSRGERDTGGTDLTPHGEAGHVLAGGVEVEVTTFEEWEAAGRTFDAVVAGQTWHWVEPVAGAVKAAAVLRAGGLLSVFWNDGRPSDELAEAFAAVYRRVLPGSLAERMWAAGSVGYGALCDKAAEGIRQAGGFAEPERWRFTWERVYTRDEWLDQLPTTGAHTRLTPEVMDEVLAGVGAAIDTVGGSIVVGYTTLAVTAVRE
ncbi:class I SAM-dependent methyltransferase [Nonomuraea sp. NPDC050556]|uniref:class I SAM-dependent methyltransferase n=1 Tax=Nonomuraea sp. NPDC050556 TaxID=3364369 RepID=UPI0037BBAE7D